MFRILTAILYLFALPAWSGDDLATIYRLARQYDPQLKAAEASYLASQAGQKASYSSLLPKLSASADSGYVWREVETEEEGSSHNFRLNLSQELFNRANASSRAQSEIRTTEAHARYSAALQDLLSRTVETYIGVLTAAEQNRLTEAEKGAIWTQLDLAKQRFESGVIAMIDVHNAQNAYDLALSEEILSAELILRRLDQLSEITGRPHAELAPLQVDLSLPTPEPTDMNTWLDAGLKNNPNILAAQYKVKNAETEIKRQEAGHYPTLDLQLSHTYSDNGYYDVSQGTEITTSYAGLRLNVPIYEGGRITAQTDQALYLHQQASEEEERVRRGVMRQIRDDYNRLISGMQQAQALERAESSARMALSATEAGVEAGTHDVTDILDSQRTLYRTQRARIINSHEYLVNLIKLKRDSGLLTEADINLLQARYIRR